MKELLNSWRGRFSEKLGLVDFPKIAARGAIDREALQILPECVDSYLVFVDGHLDLTLSRPPQGLVVLPLEASFSSYGLFLQNRWTKLIQEEKEESLLLNSALAAGSLFLYIPPGFSASNPLQIHHVFTTQELAVPRVEAILGKGAIFSIVETYQSIVDCPHHAGAWIVTLEEGASLSFLHHAVFSSFSRSFESMRLQLKRDAHFAFLHATRGGREANLSVQTELAQENSSALMQAICLLDEKRQAGCRFLARHIAPSCRSRQHVKSALFDESLVNFEGKIYVEPEAQKTESYQLNQNLLLSNLAQAKSKPALEIFADDVKASHGAIVSQLSDEELFYLSSRGLSKEEARRLLVTGYCRELVDAVSIESVRHQLLREIKQWIK